MSKGVDRNQVFLTTRVRTSLKKDGSWIQKSKQGKEEQDKACGEHAAGTKPVPVRQNSYVLFTAKKFDDSANEANGDVIPQKDAQPEGSTVETPDDTKPQASTEEGVQNGEAQPEKTEAVSPVEPAEQPAANTTAEKKEECVDTPDDQSKVERNEEASTAAHAEVIQNCETETVSKEKTEAVSPVEPAEQPVANTTAEKKEEYVDAPVESNAEQNEEAAKSSADVCAEVIQDCEAQPVFLIEEKSEEVSPVEPAEQPVTNTTAEKKEEYVDTPVDQSKVECNDEAVQASTAAHAEVIQNCETETVSKEKTEAVSPVEPAEQPVSNTVSENKEGNVGALVDQSEVEHKEEAAKSSAEVHVEEIVQNVETPSVFLIKEKTEAVSPVEPAEQPAANTTAEKEECVETPVDQSKVECNEEAVQASTAAHAEVIQNSETEPVSKEKTEAASPVEPAEQPVANTTVEKKEEYVDAPAHQSIVEYNKGDAEAGEVPAALTVKQKPEVEPSTKTEPTNVTNHEPAGVESTAHPAEESCAKCPEKYTEETVEAIAEVVEESLPETTSVTNAAAAAQETVIQDSVEPVPDLLADTVSASPTQPAAETAVKSVESKAESAAPAQPVLNTRAEEESKSEVPVAAAENTAVEPTPKTAEDQEAELRIEDAVEPAKAEAEAVQDKSVVRAIELTDALDVEAPTAEAVPEPVEDPKQSHSEEVTPNQKSDDASTAEMVQKPVEERKSTQTLYKTRDGKAVCSFCDQTIDGNVKIIFSEPLVYCHTECLKCGVCATALGDLSTPMFLHDQVILCGGCFEKALKT